MKWLRILLPLACLVARGAAAADDTPSFKVGSTIFADYTDQQLQSLTSFNVSRAYINVTGQLNHLIAFRITPDIARESGSGSSLSGSLDFRLKYAYGQFNLDDWTTKGSWVRFGVHQTPFIDDEETIYRYRFQGPTFVDREGYLVSSDTGVSAHYSLPGGLGDVHGGIYNGEGYNKPEVNREKAMQLRASVHPFAHHGIWSGLRISGFVDADHYAASAPRRRTILQATFESAKIRGGIDLLDAHDQASVNARDVTGRGWSVWAAPKLPGAWELLLRHDDLRPDTTAAQRRSRNIAGIAYWFPSLLKVTSAVMVDYDALTQRDYAPARPKDTRYGLKMQIIF